MFTIETEYPNDNNVQPAITADSLKDYAISLSTEAVEADPAGPMPTFSIGASALAGVSWEVIRSIVGNFVWDWYDSHLDDTVVKFKTKVIFIPISVTVKVKDCGWIFRALFGQRN
jgi:hypothetical protein